MKKYLIFTFFLQICFFVNAQKDIADSIYSETISFSEIEQDGKYFTFTIKEKNVGEFEKDPIKFLNTYFDASKFLKKVSDKKISSLEMFFKSSRGSLKASLNKNGEIYKTSHKCENVLIPVDVMAEIYQNHKGWTIVKNKHIAKGKAGKVDKEFFKFKMVKDGKVKRVKIPFDKTYSDRIVEH